MQAALKELKYRSWPDSRLVLGEGTFFYCHKTIIRLEVALGI